MSTRVVYLFGQVVEEVAPTVRMLVGINMALIAMVSMISALTYYTLSPASVEMPYPVSADASYVYESKFPQGELGVLNASYWVVDPQLISGIHYIENGLLKIESNNRYQVGFGMNWKSSTYEKGDWEPWLPLFWKYHVDATFVRSEEEIPILVVENWIAWETGKSITAMVWYQNGSLMYSYGAFPDDHGYGVLLGQFALLNDFNVTVDADYRAKSMTVDWSNHRYVVPLQIERIGTIPRPFTHFQITLMGPGTVYVKNLKVVLANS
jgi:hypothetical protein